MEENKNTKPNPMDLPKFEAVIKRTEEIKRDSVKIGILEEIYRQLKDIKEFLINSKKENDIIKKEIEELKKKIDGKANKLSFDGGN